MATLGLVRRWQIWKALGLLVLFMVGMASAWAQPTPPAPPPQLVGYTHLPKLPLALSANDRQWLAAHRTLVVGVLPNDLVPFDLIGLDNEYKGISADYLDAIATALDVDIQVKTFASIEEVTAALAKGDIDILPTVPRMRASGPLALTAAYFLSRHVEVTALNGPIDRNGPISVGYVPGHVPLEGLQAAYPAAKLVPFAGVFLGLTAAADEKIALFVENGASASYLIDQYQLSKLRLANFGEQPIYSVHFAVRPGDKVLHELIDEVLTSLPLRVRQDIKARWSPTYEPTEPAERVNLSDEERKWIAAHPVVRYAAVPDRMPFMFVDPSDRYAGLTVQMMNKITSETGLKFEPTASRAGRMGDADLLPVLLSGQQPEGDVVASAPYYRGYWVLVSRVGDPDILRTDKLAGKRIAYLPPNGVAEGLKERVPGIELVPVASIAQSYEDVASGKADVTVGNVNTATYLIRQSYANQLKVAGAIGDAPVDVAFGVRGDNPLLLSIINKTLLSITPEEMRRLRTNWTFSDHPSTGWSHYAHWIYPIGAALLLCLVLVAFWNRALKKQVTRRLEAEAELRDQLIFQRAMLEGIPHAICVRDMHARLIFCNAAFENFFHVDRQDVLGKTLTESNVTEATPKQVRSVHAQYMRLVAEGGSINEDLDVMLGGEVKHINHWAAPISLVEGGARVAFVSGAIDMTERQQMVAQIETAREKAEAANRAKSNFLATMSHEIRTPMNAVLGMLELMVREGRLSREDLASADLARKSAQGLLGLIDDILDISKIEAGGLEVIPRPAQLRPLIREVANVFASMARQRGLGIAVEIDERVAQWHAVDGVRFRQIVNNLVSNAIKYTDEGGVTVRLRHVARAEDTEYIELEVKDTGIGIGATDLANLFKPFFQAEAAGPRAIGGTGLGLPIVQRLCTKMGAEISVQSQRGKGTQVLVELRLPVVAAPAGWQDAVEAEGAPEAPASSLRGGRVLVVDDHPANRMLLKRQLEFLGMQCETAEDGEIALDVWRHDDFDVVITDCSMPEMDGYELTEAIRAIEQEKGLPRRPVLGCTAHVQEKERQHALDVGMDECLMKPLSVDTLRDALRRHLHGGAAEVPASEQPASESATDLPFDLSTLKAFSGGDPAIEASFMEALLRSNLSDAEELAEHVQSGDMGKAASGAHKIKGAARLVKAESVMRDCEALEAAAKEGDTATAREHFAALQHSLAEFNDALTALLQATVPLAH
ncbi:transporter substrate-binding domain-containing protein [Variovorax robiniae]|uniref:histidine kinase n=1 Tax=Variovorax robiniae TaxID=1836199 RepID=A0ABU8X316_9BURK